MTTELTARVSLQDGLRFVGSAGSGYTVQLDAAPPAGAGQGLMPMELILISLASCSAMDLLAILRKKRQKVEDLEVFAQGTRRDKSPTIYTTINLDYVLRGEEIDPITVEDTLNMVRDRYCPVWTMLAPTADITTSFRVTGERPVHGQAD